MLNILKRIFAKATDIGQYGEGVACKFLKQKKFKIVTRNWRYKHAEVDIIALNRDVLVFVEVRLRNKNALVRGLESISANKKTVLKHACLAYIKKYTKKVTTYRFDVIDIEHDYEKNEDVIFHFENVALF